MNYFQESKKIYFLGLKGVGMAMLAQFLKARGHEVCGSDVKEVFLTDEVLKRKKIPVFSPFSLKNIPKDLDLVIYSSAFRADNNEEMAYISSATFKERGVRVLSYAEALGEVFSSYQGLAVIGSHGKTTTSAWLGYVLKSAGVSPNVLVGSNVPQLGGSAISGRSNYFVAEVDEYQNKLQYFFPFGALLNNIDYDHPDFFPSVSEYLKVFKEFVKKIPASGFLVFNGEDGNIKKILSATKCKLISYGEYGQGKFDYTFKFLGLKRGQQEFILYYRHKSLGVFRVSLPGKHNLYNALAVIAASQELGLKLEKIKKALSVFKGTTRRLERVGSYRGAVLIDDYAHHPTEIKASLEALRSLYPKKKIILVFHPHTYSRTKALLKDFAASFSLAHELILLDIYASARESQGGVSSLELLDLIKKYNLKQGIQQDLRHIATVPLVAKYLKKSLGPGQVAVLMGAGDINRAAHLILGKK